MEIDFESPKQRRTTTRRLVTLAAVAAVTVGGAAACASTTASAKPSSVSTPGSSGSPSIQPGGPMIPVPSGTPSATGPATPLPGTGTGSGQGKQTFKGTGYTSNGDELTVSFYAGICDKYGLHADQSTTGRVVVTIVVTQPPKAGQSCPMLVRQQQVSTDMGSPLDGRTVVDSSTGKALPQLDAPTGTKYYSPGPVQIGS